MVEDRYLFHPADMELLKGVNLIEASAGTGKTYAIAMVVLRLIIEHSVKIDEILLVTFTRAATEELAYRIRKRLQETSDCLTGQENEVDAVLLDYIHNLTNPEYALRAINEALYDVDRAAIFTIHGFCQRMLQEQALESGQLFDVELQPELETLHINLARDYWRKNIYRLPQRQCSVVLSYFDTPDKLYRSVSSINHSFCGIEPEVGDYNDVARRFEQAFDRLASWWQTNRNRLRGALEELLAAGKLKKSFSATFPLWMEELDNFFTEQQPQAPPFEYLNWLQDEGFLGIINRVKVRGKKQEELITSLGLPDAETTELKKNITELILSLRKSLAVYMLEEKERYFQEHNCMSYDDLIVRMHSAVTDSSRQLLSILQKRFKAALIDEFQDTDLLQWQIFSSLFSKGNHFLYLIGDPKQSIYGFRGADINSYFLAQQSADRILTLNKNFRAHPNLVAAINNLFTTREEPFVYSAEKLAYKAVEAAVSSQECDLENEGKSVAKTIYCQIDSCTERNDGTWNSGNASVAIREFVVDEIARLLNNDFMLRDRGKSQTLRPGEIAILVKKHKQAEEYQHHLALTGIPTVLTSRQSVFSTSECLHMYTLLQAIAEPGDTVRLKQAMVIPWFGFLGDQLYEIWHDEQEFYQFHLKVNEYAELWKNKGVFSMLKQVLKRERILQTVSLMELAERKIANINHLLELIQQEETENMSGPLQLLQWLRNQMDKATGEEELRLESDDEAVKIITMHSAKGLEYPVVFSPYLWYRQKKRRAVHDSIPYNTAEGRILDLGSESFTQRLLLAEKENLAEEMRLLYVASTRAKLRSYVFWVDMVGRKNGPFDSFDSALGYLLFPEGRISFAEQQTRLKMLCGDNTSDYVLIESDQDWGSVVKTGELDEKKLRARIPSQKSYLTEWQMTSYSALVTAGEHTAQHYALDEKNRLDDFGLQFAKLPAGAQFGNVIHDILEQFSFKELTEPRAIRREITKIVDKYKVDLDIKLVEKLLAKIVTANVLSHIQHNSTHFSLVDLDEERCVKEMGFYFHLQRGKASELNRLLAGEATFTELQEKNLVGYLTGFIDLIFQHKERYYIIDYKTNHLGHSADNYTHHNLEDAMAAHNYGLQFWLYSLVLHCHLKNSYPGYDYQLHFGGVLYLFVRGMEEEGKGIYYHKPDLKKLEQLEQILGER